MTDQSSAQRSVSASVVEGRNGVAIAAKAPRPEEGARAYRTYEVHQRERVGESTEKLKPIQLLSDDFRRDPYPLLSVLRENYPFYRDWLSNRYWLTPYNDVTSVFTDDANFETRPKAWYYALHAFGRNLGEALPVLQFEERFTDEQVRPVAERLAAALAQEGTADLAQAFAASLPLKLLVGMLDLPEADVETFVSRYWRMQRGVHFSPTLQRDGQAAMDELVAYFEPLLAQRRQHPGDDLLSVLAGLPVDGAPVGSRDVVLTLLERDHQTFHGGLANLWFLLLTHPQEYEKARSERRLMKLAYLETLRHSAPVLSADRFTRHEVERFGKLLPEGALVVCSAAAANRDPDVFSEPDRFLVDRRDLCQREPRGQYRADGLATGITLGLGKPSRHPAVPEDRPRSRYALTRDAVVDASMVLLETAGAPVLVPGAEPQLTALTLGEMHTCWALPVTFS